MKYNWTNHSKHKMKYYNLSESRIRRVIKSPLRTEEGIAPDTVAVMQPSSYKGSGTSKTWKQEIWVMYTIKKNKNQKEWAVISAWRYPGKTKPREPLPQEILNEIQEAAHVF